jgi:hypothetical protein
MLNMPSAGYVGAKSPDWLDALVWAFSELILAPQHTFSVQTLRRRSYCGSRFLPNSCSIKPRVEVIRRRFDAGIALDELEDVEEVGAHIVQLGAPSA